MIAGFLIRNLIGVTMAVCAEGVVAAVVCNYLTKTEIIKEALNKVKENSFEKAMEVVALRVKEKSKQAINLSALDEELNVIDDVELEGSSDEVEVGDLIYIKN